MTVINTDTPAPRIEKIDDVRALYEGTDTNPDLGEPLIGIEIEFALCQKEKANAPLSQKQNQNIVSQAKSINLGIRQEPPTTSIEIASNPYKPGDISTLHSNMAQQTQKLSQLVENEGAILSPFGHLPHIPLSDIIIVDTPRYQGFFGSPRSDMPEIYKFFTSCMNIQSSISYKNSDHLLRIVRIATALEPFIFITTDSSCGFFEGQPIDHVQNIACKDAVGPINAGIPDFYYTAQTGDELIEKHIDFTLHHPHVFTAWDNDGNLTRFPVGVWTSYSELEKKNFGPLTLTNYLQTQSESWRRACNIATIPDTNANIIGHRAEIGSFQNGLLHQSASALLLTYLIAFDDDFYGETQELLKNFGIDIQNLDNNRDILQQNFNNCCYHKNEYLNVPFGNKTIKDFALSFAEIIQKYAIKNNIEKLSNPLLHILDSGKPDWMVYREKFTTLQSSVAFLNSHDFKANAIITADELLNQNNVADVA